MGRRVIQTILECGHCRRIPENGECMWEMGSEGYICEECIDKDRDEEPSEE